ncbi:MAG: tetratricopeptide repeat protein [Pyrinomonadaceae bacterium]
MGQPLLLLNAALCCTLLFVNTPARVLAADSGGGAQSLPAAAHAAMSDVGQLGDEIALLRRAVERSPTNTELRRELARLLARATAGHVEAEKIYAELSKAAPHDAGLMVERADHFVRMGDAVKAAAEYRRAFDTAPDNAAALRGFVEQTARLGAEPVAVKRSVSRLAKSPANLVERLLYAELLRHESQYNEALDPLWAAQKLAPDNPIAPRAAAETWLALGYFEHAERLFTALAGRNRDYGQGLADRARVLLAAGRPEKALSVLGTASGGAAKHPSVLLALADTYHAIGRLKEELVALQDLLSLRPFEREALERLARASFALGDLKTARQACERLVRDDPQSAVAALGLGLIAKSESGTPPTPGQPDIHTARGFADKRAAGEAALFWQQSARALPHLRRAHEARPNSPRLALALAEAMLQTHDAPGAVGAYAGVAVGYGRRPDALLGLARAEQARRQPERAREFFQDVLRLDAHNFRALVGQAEALRQSGDDEQAAALLAALARFAPESALVRDGLRQALLSLGRVGAQGSHRSPHSTTQTSAPSEGFELMTEPFIAPGDVISVSVAGRPDAAEAQVDKGGTLRLPLLNVMVRVACMTESELRAKVNEQPMTRAEIKVSKYRRAPLMVEGTVHRPGGFHVRGTFDVRSALMLAGGAGPRAGRSVFVLRGGAAELCLRPPHKADVFEEYERVEVEAGRVKLEKPLRAGDAIIVPDAETVFIMGAVARPSTLSVHRDLTLTEAVRRVGGMEANALPEQIRLRRLLPQGASRQLFVVNLTDIEQGRAGDVILQSGDLVEVPATGSLIGSHSLRSLLLRPAAARPNPLALN